MTAAGPWSVKGIDPKAREIAKDLARRSGMTLGEWLNQMIIEGEPEAPPSAPEPRRPLDDLYREAQSGRRLGAYTPRSGEDADAARLGRAVETLATRLEAAEHRSVLAISGIDQSVMGVLARLDDIEREHGGGTRLETSVEEVRIAQSRIADRIRRIEGEGGPRAEGLKALEAALGRMALRLDEEAAKAAEARTAAEAAQEAAREATQSAARRLEKMETVLEAAPAAYADAEKVETVLTRMAERLDETQTRTSAAVQSLQTSFAGLDARLRSSEARSAGSSGVELERRFQSLAQDLSQKVEGSRAELAQRLRAAADGRFEKIEAALKDLGGHVEQAERRSAHAIDRIGREVLRVAHGLGERVAGSEAKLAELSQQTGERLDAVETRSTTAVEAMSGEVSRLADAMETRLKGADTAQAEALEKLGGEIARIAERLAERISTSDRRSAEAIDDVTDKVARIGAGIDERHASTASELSERIRASEERTAKLLEEARGRLDQRLATVAAAAEAAPDVAVESAPPSNADPFALPPLPASGPDMSEPVALEPEVAAAPPPLDADPFARRDPFGSGASPFDAEDEFALPAPQAAAVPPEPVFAPAPFDEAPAASADAAPFLGFSVGDFAPAPEPAPRPEQLSTREMLDAARQAVRRAAAGNRDVGPPGSVPAPPPLEPIGAAPAPRPFGLTLPGRRKKESGPTLRTIVLASVTAGAITTMGAGAYLLGGSSHDAAKGGAEVAAMEPPPTAAPLGDGTAPPNLAVAIAPPPADRSARSSATVITAKTSAGAVPIAKTAAKPAKAAGAEPSTARKPSGKDLYASAVARIDAGDLTGVADLRTAADQGVTAAQFYLARLYEAGAGGLHKDMVQARQWTARAAGGGDPSAMYNLASYLYSGDGGAKDVPGAADWFKRAAERGVVNGQYNLAQLYEKGYGVPQNTAEAYKWYLVAAGSGDTEARSAAASLKPKLTPAVQAAQEQGAAQLHAQLSGGGVQTASVSAP